MESHKIMGWHQGPGIKRLSGNEEVLGLNLTAAMQVKKKKK